MFIFSFFFLLIFPVYMVTIFQNYINTKSLFDLNYTPALLAEPEVISFSLDQEEEAEQAWPDVSES